MAFWTSLTYFMRTKVFPSMPEAEILPERMRETKLLFHREDLLAFLPKDAIVAEIGVDMGDFSESILQISQPKKLHLLDLWPPSVVKKDRYTQVVERFRKATAEGLVELHRGDSEALLEQFPDKYFDWVYLDTTHLLDKTQRELEVCSRKIKPGGIIAGHDYTSGAWDYGVRYGVVGAVNTFCNNHGWDLIALTNEASRHVSYALQKK
jgi:ubiquinone/menaquinone biosynthesis C-methylase UbiE